MSQNKPENSVEIKQAPNSKILAWKNCCLFDLSQRMSFKLCVMLAKWVNRHTKWTSIC